MLGVKEIALPDGITRPYSVWLSGEYPRELDGLCKILSLDMRVIDPAWIGMKLRKLLDFPEPQGDFFAFVPGQQEAADHPSTISYVARLILHRYAMLGMLDEDGTAAAADGHPRRRRRRREAPPVMAGAKCPECGNPTLIRKDGCDFCTSCGYVGSLRLALHSLERAPARFSARTSTKFSTVARSSDVALDFIEATTTSSEMCLRRANLRRRRDAGVLQRNVSMVTFVQAPPL